MVYEMVFAFVLSLALVCLYQNCVCLKIDTFIFNEKTSTKNGFNLIPLIPLNMPEPVLNELYPPELEKYRVLVEPSSELEVYSTVPPFLCTKSIISSGAENRLAKIDVRKIQFYKKKMM